MATKKSYSISSNGENYLHQFDSEEEACLEAASSHEPGSFFWVGAAVPPPSPEGCFDADDWVDQVLSQDEYCGDWADDWPPASKEQLAELNAEVQAAIGKWLDKHNLRPTFLSIENVKRFRCLGDGKYEPAPE